MRIAINGFGRIGRNVFRVIHQRYPDIEVVALNDLTSPQTLAHLLKYDSVHGPVPGKVKAAKRAISVDGKRIQDLDDYFTALEARDIGDTVEICKATGATLCGALPDLRAGQVLVFASTVDERRHPVRLIEVTPGSQRLDSCRPRREPPRETTAWTRITWRRLLSPGSPCATSAAKRAMPRR